MHPFDTGTAPLNWMPNILGSRSPIGHPYQEKMHWKPIKIQHRGKACKLSRTIRLPQFDRLVNKRADLSLGYLSRNARWEMLCLTNFLVSLGNICNPSHFIFSCNFHSVVTKTILSTNVKFVYLCYRNAITLNHHRRNRDWKTLLFQNID